MTSRAVLFGCALGAALVAPTTAAAAITKPVSMGLPGKYQKTFFEGNSGDANAYFPRKVTIKTGDKVRFRVLGFHNIDFPPTGGQRLPIIAPTGDKIAGEKDAAGADFWFNGQDALAFNFPALAPVGFGKTYTYNPSKRIVTGLPVIENPKPVSVKFRKAGSFSYFCDIHPGMKGVVKVVRRRSAVPSAAADAAAVRTQAAAALKTLKAINKKTVGAEIIQIGGAGAGGVESFKFFPAAPSVKVGTTVTFQMPPGSTETHTATVGPGNPDSEPDSYLGQLSGGFQGAPVIPGAAIYPSEAPGTTAAQLTTTLHGNGFWNTGALDRADQTPLGATNQVTFAQAGSFTFYCLIHPFMKATVNVTP